MKNLSNNKTEKVNVAKNNTMNYIIILLLLIIFCLVSIGMMQ